ncbi:MAG: acyl-CoA thioesterase [Enterococcus sp.]
MQQFPGYLRKPHYYETDQMGIIHHSNYIRWFEEARVEILEFLHLPYQEMEQAGIIVPVLEVTCQYKNMIRFGDLIRIDVHIDKYTGSRLDFRYEIYHPERQELLTTGTSKHCFLAQATNQILHLKKSHPDFHQRFTNYVTFVTKGEQ